MQPPFWHPNVPLSTHEEQVVQRIRRAKLFVASRAITGMICSMKRSNKSWRPSTGQASEGIRPLLQHNWPWQLSCKRTRGCLMMR